jgi:hypothetical protein
LQVLLGEVGSSLLQLFDAQSPLLLQTAPFDLRHTLLLQRPLAHAAFVVQVLPSGPLQTPPTHVAPATEQSFDVRQVPPLAFLAHVPLVQVPLVQSLALLQTPPGPEMTQTPPVHVFVKQSAAVAQVPPAWLLAHVPLVQVPVVHCAPAVHCLPAAQRVHGAAPQPDGSGPGVQTGGGLVTWALAGAMTDWMTGVAQTVAAPTRPAFLSMSRRDRPEGSGAGSAAPGARRAEDLAQSSNQFFTPSAPSSGR